jgi:hypothetical protein
VDLDETTASSTTVQTLWDSVGGGGATRGYFQDDLAPDTDPVLFRLRPGVSAYAPATQELLQVDMAQVCLSVGFC